MEKATISVSFFKYTNKVIYPFHTVSSFKYYNRQKHIEENLWIKGNLQQIWEQKTDNVNTPNLNLCNTYTA